MPVSNISIVVTDCRFNNNIATSSNGYFAPNSLHKFLSRRPSSLGSQGGGLAIVVSTRSIVNCVVNNSVFVNNTSDFIGGGLFCMTKRAHSHQTYTLENLMFINNHAVFAGALFHRSNNHTDKAFVKTTILNCIFMENIATVAGAVVIMSSFHQIINNSVEFNGCTFTKNSATDYAGTVDIVSYNIFVDRSRYTPIAFTDCNFDSNFGAGAAAINIAYYNARFNNVTFRNNTGTTVRVVAGKIYNEGNIVYYGNNAATNAIEGIVSIGGALHLLSYSQLVVQSGTHLDYISNTGRIGAAIVVEDGPPVIPPVFRNSNVHSLCFLQFSNLSFPLKPGQLSFNFTDNKAIVGSDVFARLELCSYVPPLLNHNTTGSFGSPFIAHDKNVSLLLTPSERVQLSNEPVSSYPGGTFSLKIMPKDELNSLTIDIVTVDGIRNRIDEDFYLSFSPTAKVVYPGHDVYNGRYAIRSMKDKSYVEMTSLVNMTLPIIINILELPNEPTYSNLTVTACPAGLALHEVQSSSEVKDYECKCDNDYNDNIVECVPDEGKLILKEGLWATSINTRSLNGMMEYYQCPPGYCQCSSKDKGTSTCNSVYYQDIQDRQCVCGREGYLCGSCNQTVTALLNKCVSCDHGSIALIFGLVVVDIIVITVILLSSVTIFSWLYPVLFYIQVTPYIAQYFPVTFSAVQPYLHYISSAASLYFPYDFCIYPGMTALVSYSLRYTPVLLFSTIFCSIWGLSRKFYNISVSWRGVWLLILLLFTDVVNTSVSILNCPILRDSDGHRSMRWFVDGTVECFSGGHLGLATFAILVLIVCTLLIMVVVVLGKVKKIKGCLRLRLWTTMFEKLLQEPFVDQYNWWAPTELIRRLLFIILITAFPGNLIPVMLLVMISVAIYMYIQPYQGLWTNILEVVLLGDILFMVMITSTDLFKTAAVFDSDHSFSIDQCGNVDQISEHAAVLIPFYFLPMIILFGLIAKETIDRVKTMLHNREIFPTNRHYSRRNRSTCIINGPTGHSFELKFNTLRELTLRLVLPQHQQSEETQL
ncbi:uncharacterized protein [Dysidea avara]